MFQNLYHSFIIRLKAKWLDACCNCFILYTTLFSTIDNLHALQVFINALGLVLLVGKEEYRRIAGGKQDKFRYDASDGALIPNEPEINGAKWRTFALVLDRLFFLAFFICLVLAFACVFPKPEKLFELVWWPHTPTSLL